MKHFQLLFLISILSLNLFGQYHWERHPDNPVMTATGIPGDWEENLSVLFSVLYFDNTYHMYYMGGVLVYDGFGYATSPDGITWTRYANNPILVKGTEGEWDENTITDNCVVKTDTIFHMWYTGMANHGEARIGHATSYDGLTWTKDPDNPVQDITEGLPENKFCMHSPVVYDGILFHIYYSTGIWGETRMEVNHATSEDGYNWTLDPNNPIMWGNDISRNDYRYVTWVVYNGDHYIMWYASGPNWNWVINLAVSDDGSSWEDYANNPVLTPGPSGSWEDKFIGVTSVLYDSVENKYRMWYGAVVTDWILETGYAESSPFVEIPDTAFLYALIDEGVDTDGDSLIHYKEAEEITYLEVIEKNISDMTGIEAFFNLDTLYCGQNQLTGLDVSGNRALKVLSCDSNQLTSLDISNNTELGYLHISDMPALYDVCVRDIPFPPDSVDIDTTGSPNVYFTLDCWDTPPTVYDTIFYVEENSSKYTTVGYIRAIDAEDNLLDFAIINGNIKETFSIYNSGLIRVANVDSLDYESIPQFVLTVVVTEREGPLSDTAFVTVNVEDVDETSFRTHELKNKITIFPNPASSSITIESGISDLHNIKIIYLNGQLVFSKEMAGSNYQIDLSSFPKGVYFITIRSKDFVTTRKIIKL